jgi:hypothetical protein
MSLPCRATRQSPTEGPLDTMLTIAPGGIVTTWFSDSMKPTTECRRRYWVAVLTLKPSYTANAVGDKIDLLLPLRKLVPYALGYPS